MEVLQFGYRIPFLRVPPLSKEPIPIASYSPTSTKGIALENATLSLGEKGEVEPAPLPSPGFYSQMFVVWKISELWRPVIDLSVFIRFILKTSFKMETIQSVLLSVRQGDWMVSIDLKEAYLPVSILPDSRKYLRQNFPVSGSLLRPLHGSPGLHQGYDSNLVHSPQSRHSYALIPRRLAYSIQLSRGSSPGSQYCSLSLSGVRGCRKPGEIDLRPSSEGSISRYSYRCPDFQGFSVPGTHRQAYVSRRRISVVQAAARVHLAVSFGDSVLSLPSSSGGSPPHASPPTHSTSLVGSPGRFLSGLLVGRLPPGFSLVDGPLASSSRGVSISTLTRPRLLARRIRRRLGCSPRLRSRFRPLVSGRDFSFHKHEGVASCGEGSPPFSLLCQPFHGRGVCRQLHGHGLSSQRRGHSISSPHFHSPAYPPMV